MTNIPHLIEVALLLLIAYLIGCIIGYFLRAKLFGASAQAKPSVATSTSSAAKSAVAKPAATKPAAPAAKAVSSAAAKPAPAAKAAVPEKLKAPRDGKKDNLKLIKGIGPKIESKLNEMGTFHFDQIAAWDKARIAQVDETLSFKGRIERERWVPQAKALAKK